MTQTRSEIRSYLMNVSTVLATRGWLRATSGNLSIYDRTLDALYITRSGVDKSALTPHDILKLDASGTVLEGEGKPSFETLVHRVIYSMTNAGACFHVHTLENNVMSKYAPSGFLSFSQHEMIKALGQWDEDAIITLPVVPNYADIKKLSEAVAAVVSAAVPAVLVRQHGIYAFGDTPQDALRHLEAWEFLFAWYLLDQQTTLPPTEEKRSLSHAAHS